MSELSIPGIVDAIREDLSTRGYQTVEFLYGDWKESLNNGAGRVVFGLGSFDFTDPLGPGQYPQDTNPIPTQARSLFTRVQACPIWIHAVPTCEQDDPLYAEKCQVATCQLLHAVAAALYRTATGSLSIGQGTWPKPERQEFVYGSLAMFVAKFDIPVLDDSYVFATPAADLSSKTAYFVIGGQSYEASQTP
jgi:hypothetical protein